MILRTSILKAYLAKKGAPPLCNQRSVGLLRKCRNHCHTPPLTRLPSSVVALHEVEPIGLCERFESQSKYV